MNPRANFVRIDAIASELWAINEIQNGGRRHHKLKRTEMFKIKMK